MIIDLQQKTAFFFEKISLLLFSRVNGEKINLMEQKHKK